MGKKDGLCGLNIEGSSMQEKMAVYRRDFHKYAESGWTEFRTSAVIAEKLAGMGFEVKLGKEIIKEESVMGRAEAAVINAHIERAVSQGADPGWIEKMDGLTGVAGILDTGRPGPVTAFRFDIDANDVQESGSETHRPQLEGFASVHDDMMHACGHDGHGAIGLGLAEVLTAPEVRERLTGKIKLLFQPAEEGLRGGKPMADSGIVDDVDFLLAGHVGTGVPLGAVCVSTAGYLSSTKFDVEFTGKAAHAGMAPNEGKNALLAAASATVLMHAIPPHKDGPTRINVGVLNAGVGRNVVAPNAVMKVETRGGSLAINDYVYDNAVRILEHVSAMYEVEYKLEKMGYAADCDCDPEMAALAKECAAGIPGVKEIRDFSDIGGSEDVTWLIKRVQEHGGKGNYVTIGTDIAAGHHNECFDFDESVLLIALEWYLKMLFRIAAN